MDMKREDDADLLRAKVLYNELDLKGKVGHFWEYHKNIIIAFTILVVAAVIIYMLLPEPSPEANLRIKFVNIYVNGLAEDTNIIETDYETHLGENNTCVMSFDYSELNEENERQGGKNMEGMMIEVVGSNLELFIFDEFAMNKMCPTGFLVNLNTCIENEYLQKIDDRLVYHEDEEGDIVPVAIDITDTQYVKDMGIQGENVLVSFIANSPNQEIAKEYVKYIISRG